MFRPLCCFHRDEANALSTWHDQNLDWCGVEIQTAMWYSGRERPDSLLRTRMNTQSIATTTMPFRIQQTSPIPSQYWNSPISDFREVSIAREEVLNRRGYPLYIYTNLSAVHERSGLMERRDRFIIYISILSISKVGMLSYYFCYFTLINPRRYDPFYFRFDWILEQSNLHDCQLQNNGMHLDQHLTIALSSHEVLEKWR